MRVARRLAFFLIAAMCAVLAVAGVNRVNREVELFDSDMRHDHDLVARVVADAIVALWTRHGREAARELVAGANEPRTGVLIHLVAISPGAPGEPSPRAVPEIEQLRAGGPSFHRESVDGRELWTFYPLPAVNGDRTALWISEPLTEKAAYVRTTVVQAVIATLAIMVICAVIASRLGHRLVGAPMESLVLQARRIGAGQLDARLHLDRPDELGLLAREMNAMGDALLSSRDRIAAEQDARLDALEQLRQAERLLTVGRLAAGVAHELGTPLNVVQGRAGLVADGEVAGEEARAYCRIIVAEVDRMAVIIRQLLDFARHKKPERRPCDPAALVDGACALLRPLAEKGNVSFDVDRAGARELSADAAQLQQVLVNILVNGIHAMPKGGTLHISFESVTRQNSSADVSAPFLAIIIRDQGTGMNDAVLARVFEPFFTTKDVGKGTGLGLSVSYGIVQEHAGVIEVESEPGHGSCFRVVLPLPFAA